MANNTNQAAYQHQRRTLFLICLGFFFSVILLYKVLNVLIIAVCLFTIAIRFCEVKRYIGRHPGYTDSLLSVFVIASIITLLAVNGFRTYLVNAFINLLVGSIALKFLECRQERDLIIQVVALFFLTSLTFVFSYDWYMIFYMLLCMIIDFAALMSLFACRRLNHLFKYAVRTVLLAAPLAAVIFLVLPRFNPFWQMPNATQNKTGLGEEISFDGINELVQDHSLAFRAVFEGEIPKERYFVSMVYPQLDPIKMGFMVPKGLGRYEYSLTPFSKQPLKERISFERTMGVIYNLYMEPNNRRWIPVLELSASKNENIFHTPFSVWMDKFPITQPKAYEFKYITDEYYYRQPVPFDQNTVSVLLETGYHRSNPRTRELVAQFVKAAKGDHRKIAELILDYFRDNGFTYSLKPFVSDPKSVQIYDQFLFENRNGFCNHYSSSMTYMLRLAGIPAMTVGGFLGGEVVRDSNYVIVRNSDAHSWVSAYIDDRWQRIDPVTVIEPDRINNAFVNMHAPAIVQYAKAEVYQNSAVKWFRDILEAIEFRWNMTVLNYNFDDNSGFVTRFFREKTILAAICLILSITVMIYLSLRIARLFSRKEQVNKAVAMYRQFVVLLVGLGLKKRGYETPDQFCSVVFKVFGDCALTQKFKTATEVLTSHLYRESLNEKEAAGKLKILLKEFRLSIKDYKKSRHRKKKK